MTSEQIITKWTTSLCPVILQVIFHGLFLGIYLILNLCYRSEASDFKLAPKWRFVKVLRSLVLSPDLQWSGSVLFQVWPAPLAHRRCVSFSCRGRGRCMTLTPDQQASSNQLRPKLQTDTWASDIWPMTRRQTVSCLRNWTTCLYQSCCSVPSDLRTSLWAAATHRPQ